ncbi:uncharacterized protein [Littorina saxatilis]|uniref:uncharacterized protein n=1 Tax=Littorina saxatilis TaxID=31220 RepID=UPI0038B46DE1
MAAQRVRCPALWVGGDSFTLYLLQSSSTCLAVSNQARAHSGVKCQDGFVLASLADVTQLQELGTVLTSGVTYHIDVTLQTGVYEWSDGQPVDGALWASGAPPSGGQCVAVQRSASASGSGSTRLTGVDCATSEKYVCRSTSRGCSGATIITPLPTATITSTAVTPTTAIPTTTASTQQPTTLHADTTASQSDVETTSQSDVETTSQSDVETTSQSEVETTSQSEVETTSQSVVETTSQSEVETTSQSEVETTSQSEVETTSQSEVETTSQSGDTVPPLTSQAQYRACRCQRAVQTNDTARAARVQEAMVSAERVRLDLTLVKQNLSSAVRTKTSARDDRWSARAAGGVSIACLVLVFGTIFLLDLSRLAPLLASLTARVDSSTDR